MQSSSSMERNTKETLRRANFPFEKLDMISIPRDSTDSAESDGGGKENKKKNGGTRCGTVFGF